ncbi:MAG: hypothetical protein ACOYMR_12155 [Ilumatobacteraceae bacterium]
MPACEPLVGWRIIADPAALDAAPWPSGSRVVRISPDDVFLIGAAEPTVPADEHAIVTPEHGFSGSSLTAEQVADIALHHIEWALPGARPCVSQGQIAGVPAKLVLHEDGSALLLVACAAQRELEERLA